MVTIFVQYFALRFLFFTVCFALVPRLVVFAGDARIVCTFFRFPSLWSIPLMSGLLLVTIFAQYFSLRFLVFTVCFALVPRLVVFAIDARMVCTFFSFPILLVHSIDVRSSDILRLAFLFCIRPKTSEQKWVSWDHQWVGHGLIDPESQGFRPPLDSSYPSLVCQCQCLSVSLSSVLSSVFLFGSGLPGGPFKGPFPGKSVSQSVSQSLIWGILDPFSWHR